MEPLSRALEVVYNFQPLEINSERALTLAVHWQSRLADTKATRTLVLFYL